LDTQNRGWKQTKQQQKHNTTQKTKNSNTDPIKTGREPRCL
jgi:hypothetical protein